MSVQVVAPSIQSLNTNIEALTKALTEKGVPRFAEPQETQNGYAMSMGGLFTISRGNLLVMALGVALSSAITGAFAKFLPFGTGGLAKVIVAIVLKKLIAKSGFLEDFANGVLLAGVAELAGGLTSGITGMFNEKYNPNKSPSLVSYNEPTGYPAMAPVAWR